MDKRSILLPLPLQFKLFGLTILLFLIAACAATGQEQAPDELPETPVVDSAPEVGDPDRLSPDADPEVLFHVLAAERLIGMGQYTDAIDQYLAAAMLADDAQLARQVTRLAAQIGEWESAVSGANRWLELEPGNNDARQILILAWINSGEVAQAVDALADLLEEHEHDQEGWRRAAMLIGAADDEQQALRIMSRLIEREAGDAASPEIRYIQSVLLWQIGDPEGALDLARTAAEASSNRKHKIWAAQLAAGNEQYGLALEIYRQARVGDPGDVPLALAEAEVLRQLDRTDEALAVLRAMPPDRDVLYTEAIYLVQAEREQEAEDAWQRLAGMTVEEEVAQHAFLVAHLAELLERDAEALAWYEKVESGPSQNRALLRRAILEGRAGNLMVARNLLRSVRMGDDPRLSFQSWLVEAELLRESGMADEAVALMGQALRESPNNIDLLYTRALSAVANDDIDLAEQDLRRIIQLDSENAMALNALGYTLTDRTDRHQEAYRLIRRALELDPDDPATLDSMGWVYFRLGQPEKALPYLERALEGEDNAEIAAHLIEVLWYLERRDEAMEILDHALENYPDDDYLTDTLERLGLPE